MTASLKDELLAWFSGPQSCDEKEALRARLLRAEVREPEPTEAKLREQLKAALPEGWEVHHAIAVPLDLYCWAQRPDSDSNGRVAYAALRAPDGIRTCAEALKTLAGVA